MGGDTPRQLIQYESSPANSSLNSGSNLREDPNSSLNSSSNTNTGSTTSTTRYLNERNSGTTKGDDLIITISKSNTVNDYDQPINTSIPKNHLYQYEETEDFLPICDALFNVICLVAYFCDIVFDALTAYTLYQDGLTAWAIVVTTLIVTSVVVSQIVSYHWYSQKRETSEPHCSTTVLILMHLSLCGVLWRYFKLFIPLDVRFVKSEVRDLCILRLIHAFVEAGPLLILQLYLILLKSHPDQISDLTLVSTTLSLFTVCWALASFSKNVRRQNVHKLVLTWLGVIFQFLWRAGTVTSRAVSLALYATVYTYLTFLVIILHWFVMLLWLISPQNLFQGEKMSRVKKCGYSALIAAVYVFCFINIQEVSSRQKVIIFYVTMFLENVLLLGVSFIAGKHDGVWFKEFVISTIFGGFAGGIFFMLLYYRYFHLKKLNYEGEGLENRPTAANNNESGDCAYYSSATLKHCDNSHYPPNSHQNSPNFLLESGDGGSFRPKAFYNKINGHHIHHSHVPGVFNCRFNPAIKRKKKKPSSFVPPPPPAANVLPSNETTKESIAFTSLRPQPNPLVTPLTSRSGRTMNPFWKRPVSPNTLTEKESNPERINLRTEDEETGRKLRRPISEASCNDIQALPIERKPWFRPSGPIDSRPPLLFQSSNELILHPQYLLHQNQEGPSGFYDRVEWMSSVHEPVYYAEEDGAGFSESVSDVMNERTRRRGKPDLHADDGSYCHNSYRARYDEQRRGKRASKTEAVVPSTNSSDGDVDSEDEDVYTEEILSESGYSQPYLPSNSVQYQKRMKKKKPETPL